MKRIFSKLINAFGESLRFTKIRMRLFTSLLLLSFIPLIITGFISYNKSNSSIQAKIGAYSAENMRQVAGNVDTAVKKYEGNINDIALAKEVQDNITILNGQDKLAMTKATRDLGLYLTKKTVNWSNPVYEIYISKDRQIFNKNLEDYISNQDHLAILEKAYASSGCLWNMVRDSSGTCYLLVSQKIVLIGTDEVMGVVSILINPDEFSAIFRDMRIGAGTKVFMLDETGTVLASGDGSVAVGSAYQPSDLIKKFNQEQKPFNYSIAGEKNLVSYSKIASQTWYIVSSIPFSFLNAESEDIKNAIILIAVLCLVIAVLASFVITSSISSPLKRLMKLMSEAKAGNLAVNMRDGKRDEISGVISHFNDMVSNFRELLAKVSKSSDRVLTGSDDLTSYAGKLSSLSGQVAGMMQQIAGGAQDQAEGVGKGVLCMNRLDENIKLVETKMLTVSSEINNARLLSGNALVSVGMLSEKAEITKDASAQIADNINELYAFMHEIKNILKIITSLSDQTNLLALNASIEAARAGSYGYGFAVVADEIKKLADQSKDSSQMIHDIIGNIQRKTDKAVTAAKNSGVAIMEQMEALRQTDESFKLIQESMEHVAANIIEIDQCIGKVANNRDQTLDSMQNISAVVEQAASATQQVSAATQEQMKDAESVSMLSGTLRAMASELMESVSLFKV